MAQCKPSLTVLVVLILAFSFMSAWYPLLFRRVLLASSAVLSIRPKNLILFRPWVDRGSRLEGDLPSVSAAPESNNTVRFGIATSIYSSGSDERFALPCLMALTSIAKQTYPDWTLVLVGDGLNESDIPLVHAAIKKSSIPASKYVFRNMDVSKREENVYGKDFTELNMFVGINVMNEALAVAYSLTGVSHIARLDIDDAWSDSHLQNLADAYALFPNATFAYTQVRAESLFFNQQAASSKSQISINDRLCSAGAGLQWR